MSTVEDSHALYYIVLYKPCTMSTICSNNFCTVIHPLFLPRLVEGVHPILNRYPDTLIMHLRMFRLNFQRLVRGFAKLLLK